MKQKENYRKIYILIFSISALFFQSCFLDCSYHAKIEFDNSNKSIKVLSDNYCITSVELTEYEPMEGYIREIENNTVKIELDQQKAIKSIHLSSLLNAKENNLNQALVDNKYVEYEIVLHEIQPASHSEDTKYIQFVNQEVEKGEKVFESEGCK